MPDSNVDLVTSKTPGSHIQYGFVAGGYDNLVKGCESEFRRIVEEKYAGEWNASGVVRRFFLRRKMDREVAELVAESMPTVSQEALF